MMRFRLRLPIGPVGRLSIGVISLILSLILIADALFGLLPGRHEQEVERRQFAGRIIGEQVGIFILKSDQEGLQVLVDRLASDKTDIDSIGIRQADQTLVAASRDHSALWAAAGQETSTARQVVVPLYASSTRWGEVQLLFANQHAHFFMELLSKPTVLLLGLLSTLGLLFIYMYLRRALQYLNPTDSVPKRVQTAFDTLTESVLVLDHKERIMLANASFRKMAGDPDIEGRHISHLAWLMAALREKGHISRPWLSVLHSGHALQGQNLGVSLPDGSRRELIMNCSAIRDESDIARGCLVSFEDVTALRQANAELADTVQTLRRLEAQLLENNHELERVNK